jgi:RHH-type proline utilization regulon transcriptional repressor/proline dehydrogenase/delta 1-pyrroline-5-carboxylate dehydrogenase
LQREVFGPVIHIIRFDGEELDKVIADINSSGYGLTQGLHSRLEETATAVYRKIKAGNIYINRNTVGAVVGVQPFGGEGLSGTGPKAGGPLYLYRLVDTQQHPSYIAKPRSVNFTQLDDFVYSLGQLDLTTEQIHQLGDLSRKLKSSSVLHDEVPLPGPTGERNFMFFAPRGYIACVADSLYGYCEQVIYALSTGNQVILLIDGVANELSKIMSKKSYFAYDVTKADLVHAVLVSANHANLAQLRSEFAVRDSLLTHVVEQNITGGYNSHLLVTERTVSINITATGGNVQLMSIHDTVE